MNQYIMAKARKYVAAGKMAKKSYKAMAPSARPSERSYINQQFDIFKGVQA